MRKLSRLQIEGRDKRQRILDFLKQTTGANRPEIVQATGIPRGSVNSVLRQMAALGEIEVITPPGKTRTYTTFIARAERCEIAPPAPNAYARKTNENPVNPPYGALPYESAHITNGAAR